MTTILLIRHAQNDMVKKRVLAGWMAGVHLDEEGRAQAQRLAQSLASTKLKAVYSSPLERAVETAQPIAAAQGLAVQTRPGLGEVRFGRWQGQSLKSLRRRKLWPVVQMRPSMARFPEGESFQEAQARIVAELAQLQQSHSGRKQVIACVSHADAIKLAIAYYIGLPLDLFQRLEVMPASINVLELGSTSARLIRLNDSHAAQPAKRG